MVKSLETSDPKLLKPGIKAPVQETLLTPRFYTTDFEAVANLDISANETELLAVVEELRADYNRHHFVRDQEFQQSWEHVDEEKRRTFIDFLERSCTSEFSGFLLFKELSRRLKEKNPLLADAFNYMARDEARHAGFLNKSMADFNLSLDLSYLTKHRTYTFFPPEWVIYTVYLSEKIGYWRYILVHRHMQEHPEYQFYPLFRKFESWCQDENRHGDFFKALLRSQPKLWNNWRARLWVRFFLLTVFVTHTITVFERATFYEAIGIHPRKYNNRVIQETNNTSARAFPLILNTNHPAFFWRLEQCFINTQRLTEIKESSRPGFVKFWQKIPPFCGIIYQMLRLYWIKPIDAESTRGKVH
ncbi:magnesium-protoporphyrin IX monomethyl ester (oxidative) cyclase [Umezakia ovalisporum]|jgi:magnesium-protoporphyrin IX monomethyl ester (oxidative) cyclase|uniref:Magnesium-protoporphyrin IX monomethyl ester [oxidative] cyclase n=2 Tax=Umezakia ovalisporum TaxID=75695 RepID=A0AA43KDN8_9CYAN|nr:magnesium-protoporphyrin IX monomethyl ester (oxidative) cyclase [Umezakia ovalisporum]MBI1243171.1 magnesium-protoporphyrin IX monomethyl ester (oxidative) cyclase [Nostoc sp. RI_552]MDH6055389.1 magnesium-protoporphyrin IX monomethyl ester (oxidative) cyclase [Umezakia ovalisporum FSS-43]MDH6062562.1 magnesium-protoporphyrin IX monomethyl ester (oxidative) cyclase [Umezakia ovalisporum FSS-62]MDH6068036.1 magnesium-protoporphyrin IX monomethyl ester (oxidative) cyclase [Umezakia ovalisporu